MKTKVINIIASGDAFTLADVALCIMDEVAARTCHHEGQNNDEPTYAWLKQEEGIAMVRSNIIEMAHWFEMGWQIAQSRDRYPTFDWEMVPGMLDYFMEHAATPDDIDEAMAIAATDHFLNTTTE